MDFARFTLAASTATLGDEPAARAFADCLEYRMDLATTPLSALKAYDGKLPLIVTNRSRREGGAADPDDRIERLEAAIDLDSVEAVDVELAAVRSGEAGSLIDAASDRDVALIVSAHDVDGTPPEPELLETLRAAASIGDVAKLATTARSPADALALLVATERASREGLTVATMAMGEVGRHTRAVAPAYGSKVGYAPMDVDEATAPGQYDLETLASLVESLQSVDGGGSS